MTWVLADLNPLEKNLNPLKVGKDIPKIFFVN